MNFDDIANPWISKLLTYEPGRPIDEVARELGFESADEIDKLASNENALGPSPKAVEAMQAASSDMHYYPDGGAYYLKRAIAGKLGVEPENVLPVNGSNEAIELMGHAFLDKGSSIVMADYAFIVYRLIAAMFQSDVISVPMKDLTHDLDAMCSAITDQTKLVFVSNPNNPTSTMVTSEELDAFMEKVPDHVIVCFDEAYIELLPDSIQPDTLKYVREGRKVIVLRTFSKTYGLAGLRIGYAIAPAECIALMNKARQPFNANAMAQVAAVAALGDDEHVEKTRRTVADGIVYLQSEFDRMGIEYVPACANFVLIKVGPGREVFQELQKKGVIVRPMDGYKLPEYVRVTVGTQAQNERFIGALSEVTEATGRTD